MERNDGSHEDLDALVGPIVYRREIGELAGEFLAEYRTEIITVHLSAEDRQAYETARATYRAFVDVHGIRMGGRDGWRRFLRESARSKDGRAAHRAWRVLVSWRRAP